MKIVVAPDSFKGSISSRSICKAVKKGIVRVLPSANVVEIPLADGGEGTMETFVYATNGFKKQVIVTDPLGKKRKAEYGVLGDGKTVIVEMAQASGLPLLREHEKNPLVTTTFGTGQLIKAALDEGYRQFIIGIGGSATNDGGMGMLKALGVEFIDKDGNQLPEGGAALRFLHQIDDSSLDERLKESTIIVASDVTNPLCGPNGASAVFGPQKGATPVMVKQLDEALDHYANIVQQQKRMDMRELVGGGAAGGLGAALITFLGVTLHSGIHIMMQQLHFEEVIKDASLIITGEGRLDEQTLSGKVISGICDAAKCQNVPVIVICGELGLEANRFDELGILSAFSIIQKPCTLEDALIHTQDWIAEQMESIMRLLAFKRMK